MTGKHGHQGDRDEHRTAPPRTAVGEVLREFEDAETDVAEERDRRHGGQAGEAITPNVSAQEQAEREAREGSRDE
ncbi:hypothetical protein [Streptomyces naganishii]|uniref:Uncharacterized protein n=1 Tax=Streptomyces naganishii JCM 4654 TaxID=1306179 RepID=A0A918Y250_9ACTN|nr:hypothetical protein [Streptomyces naganishii]GHD88368.1 hypothetical protein GCM10010508_24240 [Streptomyces naganishii JCM 4654]